MRVQEVILNDNKKRYLMLDEVGVPVVPVMKYLKYLDQTGKSNNTLKTYCYALKQYFTYLEERKIDYKEVGVKDLADFVGWLRNPFESGKVTPLQQIEAKRTEKSVNLIITVVTNLYDYFFIFLIDRLPYKLRSTTNILNQYCIKNYMSVAFFSNFEKISAPRE